MQKIDCSKRFRIWKLEILFFWKELKKKKIAKISQENNFSFYRTWSMDHINITCSSSSVINILSKLLFILSEEFF